MLLAPPAVSNRARNRGTSDSPSLWDGLWAWCPAMPGQRTRVFGLGLADGMSGFDAIPQNFDGDEQVGYSSGPVPLTRLEQSRSEHYLVAPGGAFLCSGVTSMTAFWHGVLLEDPITQGYSAIMGQWGIAGVNIWSLVHIDAFGRSARTLEFGTGGTNISISLAASDIGKPLSAAVTYRASDQHQGLYVWAESGFYSATNTAGKASALTTGYSPMSINRQDGRYVDCAVGAVYVWPSRVHDMASLRRLAYDPLAPVRPRRRLSLLVPELGGGGASSGDTTDAALIGDTHTATVTSPAATSDAGLIADTQAPLATVAAATTDAALVADTQSATAAASVTVVDAALISDTQIGATSSAETVDAILISDVFSAAATVPAVTVDASQISGTIASLAVAPVTTSDAAMIADAIAATAVAVATTVDTALVSDSHTVVATAAAVVTNAMLASDVAVGVGTYDSSLLLGDIYIFPAVEGTVTIYAGVGGLIEAIPAVLGEASCNST